MAFIPSKDRDERHSRYSQIEDLLNDLAGVKRVKGRNTNLVVFSFWCISENLPSPCDWKLEELDSLIKKLKAKKKEKEV